MKRVFRKPSTKIVAAVVMLAAVGFVLVSAAGTMAADSGSATSARHVIDTGAPVTDSSQCTPCHLDIGAVKKPGLIFGHGNHLLVSCDGCHSRMPHTSAGTDSVPMEVCFACHGVRHGPQGPLATADCRKCHTPSFDLVPADHKPLGAFGGRAHAEAARRIGVNRCMMCHTASKDCNDCHSEKHVKIAPLPDAYVSVIGLRPKPASVKIYPSGPTNMAQCQYCHADLDNIVPGRLIFAHAAHLQRDYSCETCHPKFGHTANGPAKPDMQSCYRCHGLQHQGQGLVATAECNKCHPPGFKLMPDNHTTQFVAGGHKGRASSDPSYCAMCHKTQFCVECHSGRGTGPNAPKKPVVPEGHSDARWQARHGQLFLAKKGDCGACHDDASCKTCHKTVMPHPPQWIENHKPGPGVSPDDCNICHTNRSACQNCHHGALKSADLVEKNCVRCHAILKTKPATSIKNREMVEHAVHFEVPKYKGKAYKCYECHSDFGTNTSSSKSSLRQGHDVRLCYSCHGALDPVTHEKVALYPGAELCRRCHSNLNF